MNAKFEITAAKSTVYSLLDQVANMNALIEDITEKIQALALDLELLSMPKMDDEEINRICAMLHQEILQEEAEEAKFTDGTVISEELIERANDAVRKAIRHRGRVLAGSDSVIS